MAEQLRQMQADMIDLPIAPPRPSIATRMTWRIYRACGWTDHGGIFWMRTRAYARQAAKNLDPRLAASRLDLVFGALAGRELAAVRSPVPLVYCTDYTVPRLLELSVYPLYDRMSKRSIKIATALEADLVRRASINLVPGQWIANSLMEHYGVPAERIRVIPWGANIDSVDVPNSADVSRDSPGKVCSLLFLGVDWSRKGGDLAHETLQRLLDRGVPAELIVVGCQPPQGREKPKMQVLGRLKKSDPTDRRKLSELLRTSSFLLLPTRGDCYPHVFCEAGAYGLPSITTRVGGVGEVVRDGENGAALPLSAGADEYAETITRLWANHDEYLAMSIGARRAFDERLNWNVWGRQARATLGAILNRR